MKVSEEIAELNFREFYRRGQIYIAAPNVNRATGEPFSETEFHDNMLYSFPSNDQISCIFLWDLSNKQYVYQSEMNKVTGLAITCDQTVKVSKSVGVLRPAQYEKFITQFKNLYIIMNELKKEKSSIGDSLSQLLSKKARSVRGV